MNAYTVFFDPLDQPDKFVARLFRIDGLGSTPTSEHCISDSKEEAVKWCQGHSPIVLARFPRDPGDDVSVVESWI